MKIVTRVLVTILVVLVVVVAGGAIYVASRQHLTFDVPYPPVNASTDTAVVARGRYVVRVVAECDGCHGDVKAHEARMNGAEVPLSGGFVFKIPPGEFYPRNITPDPETGIGNFPDKAVARALRYGVGHDGRALLPFMEMQGLSDEDLVAVVSYLRSQPPVRNAVPMHHYNVLGKIVRATVLAKPVGPKSTPPTVSPRGATLENGRYLAGSVAHCGGCHTERNSNTGALVGALYSGATRQPDDFDPKRFWSPPNLTSDPKTGRLASMSEDQFVARFRAGRIIPGSPMPWQAFQRMHEDDVRAIYRFLKSLPPVEHDVGPATGARTKA